MAAVTIRNDSTRRVIECVLWTWMATEIGEILYDVLIGCGDVVYRGDDDLSEADRNLAALREGRAAIDRIRTAVAGQTVELPMSVDGLAEGLENCRLDVEGFEGLLHSPDRDRFIADREEAVSLLAQLLVEAVS
jgi:hypothetical protein